MPYSADAIANFFLDRASESGRALTPMQIQKLVFYAHGWHLALDKQGRPLIRENVEAWRFGPVIRSLYGEFSQFRNSQISHRAREVRSQRLADGKLSFKIYEPSLENENPTDVDPELARAILNRVWELYGGLSGYQLSNMTHAENEPWRIIQRAFQGNLPRGLHIPNETIRDCFQQKLAAMPSS